jgi:hypothetical protein
MKKPGPAGKTKMGNKNKFKKSTVKLTPEQIATIKNELHNKQSSTPTMIHKNLANSTENVKYDNKKVLTNDTDGPKYLIMHRTDDNKTMRDYSPILLETVIKNATNNAKVEVKFLKSGDVLIKTENVKQAQNLIKLTGIMDTTVEVYEHKTMNSSKGVIRAYELQNENKETLLDYLKAQNVTDLHFHSRITNGTTLNTGLVFVTFGVNVLPEYLTVGFLRLVVRPYIPSPMRCFVCHKYGHLSKHCNIKDTPTCYNCNKAKHIHTKEEKCTEISHCVNCNETGHNSYNRTCTEYKRQVEIQTIKATQNVSMAEAVKRFNINKKSFAQVTATATQCTCKHCEYHNKTERSPEATTSKMQDANNAPKRARQQKINSNDLNTDEEYHKKLKVNDIESDAYDDEEMNAT